MDIPLANKLKKRLHLETAFLQDEIVNLAYDISQPILHGGTAIWRCYQGNRFSEDLDFYLPSITDFKEKFTEKINERNLILDKYKETDNLIFAKISNGTVEVRFEANFSKKAKAIAKPYEKTNGSFTDILTLSPDDLIIEKINAYNSRKLIRDIYDVYHLTKFIEKQESFEAAKRFATSIAPPLDEKNLKVLVYAGIAPSFEQMVTTLQRLK